MIDSFIYRFYISQLPKFTPRDVDSSVFMYSMKCDLELKNHSSYDITSKLILKNQLVLIYKSNIKYILIFRELDILWISVIRTSIINPHSYFEEYNNKLSKLPYDKHIEIIDKLKHAGFFSQ